MAKFSVVDDHVTYLADNVEDETLDNTWDDIFYLDIALGIIAPLIVSMAGVVSNILNMAIFAKLGLKDCMSAELFALSLTDFLVTLLHAAISLCYFVNLLYEESPIDPWALGYFALGWAFNAMYLTSCWITALITVERCFCVVSPFKVKLVFTRFRCIVIILIIYVVNIGIHVPIYVTHRMEWVDSLSLDNTGQPARIYTVTSDEETARVEMIFDITVTLAVSDMLLIAVTACTVRMVFALKDTSKVRHGANREPYLISGSSAPRLSSKERKLLKVVLALAITLSVCGLPKILVVTIYNIVPGLNVGPVPRYITTMWSAAHICSSLGCTITIVVYLALNTNYRTVFYQCLGYHK